MFLITIFWDNEFPFPNCMVWLFIKKLGRVSARKSILADEARSSTSETCINCFLDSGFWEGGVVQLTRQTLTIIAEKERSHSRESSRMWEWSVHWTTARQTRLLRKQLRHIQRLHHWMCKKNTESLKNFIQRHQDHTEMISQYFNTSPVRETFRNIRLPEKAQNTGGEDTFSSQEGASLLYRKKHMINESRRSLQSLLANCIINFCWVWLQVNYHLPKP